MYKVWRYIESQTHKARKKIVGEMMSDFFLKETLLDFPTNSNHFFDRKNFSFIFFLLKLRSLSMWTSPKKKKITKEIESLKYEKNITEKYVKCHLQERPNGWGDRKKKRKKKLKKKFKKKK